MIKYDLGRKAYMIKDLGDGNGTFIKIVPRFTLFSGCMISFGEVHLTVQIKLATTDNLSYDT